jgi:hypothetical protein
VTMPRLSESLRALEWPHRCQRCGALEGLVVWQEHDEGDRPESRYVVLCRECADRVIERHPRLYRELAPNEPAAGVMRLCGYCVHQDAGRCRSPRARANGGQGLRFPGPDSTMHILYSTGRGRRGQWLKTWSREPIECEGFELIEGREVPDLELMAGAVDVATKLEDMRMARRGSYAAPLDMPSSMRPAFEEWLREEPEIVRILGALERREWREFPGCAAWRLETPDLAALKAEVIRRIEAAGGRVELGVNMVATVAGGELRIAMA